MGLNTPDISQLFWYLAGGWNNTWFLRGSLGSYYTEQKRKVILPEKWFLFQKPEKSL